MPPAQKGYKTINHRDTNYRWIMRNLRGVNELVVVASAPVNGRLLIAELPRIVSLNMITEAIDFGHAHDWRPDESAPPLRCKYQHRAFHLADG